MTQSNQPPPFEGGISRELRLEVAMLLGNSHLYQWALDCTDEEYANKEIALIWAKKEYEKSNDHRLENLARLYQKALGRL